MTFEEELKEIVGQVNVLCTCQQRDTPSEWGCAFCEGSGTREIVVRRDGMVRITRGVEEPSEWQRL